jgi:hypothetical protein
MNLNPGGFRSSVARKLARKLSGPDARSTVLEARSCLHQVVADLEELRLRVQALKALAVIPTEFLAATAEDSRVTFPAR